MARGYGIRTHKEQKTGFAGGLKICLKFKVGIQELLNFKQEIL